ncbi:MAG: ATP-binding protein, partial [Actinomycetota bacterium]|nr:ATP-binding protein [Actinomycetota bacterium]
EHAFDAAEDYAVAPPTGTVVLELRNQSHRLEVTVADDGKGLPDGFSVDKSDSLGLSIVSRLVTTQLGGSISMERGEEGGTVVRLAVPTRPAAA